MKTLMGVFIILFGLFEYGSSIICYECNSSINSLCWEKHPPESLKRNCSDHYKGVTHTLCRKIIQHVDYGVNGRYPESRLIRSCGWDETKFKGMCYHRAGYGGRQEVCSCLTDLCNSANGAMGTHSLLILIPVIVFIRKLYQ